MKGKGDKDVYVLQNDVLLEQEDQIQIDRKHSLRKSVYEDLIEKSAKRSNPMNEPNVKEFTLRTSTESPIPISFKTFGGARGPSMPFLNELNEGRQPYDMNDSKPKLELKDLDSSHESDSKSKSDALAHLDDSDKPVQFHEDAHFSPRRSTVNKIRINGTRMPSSQDLKRRFDIEIENRDSMRNIASYLPDLEAIDEEQEILSAGLLKMKKRLKDEDMLSKLSLKSPFLKKISKFNQADLQENSPIQLSPVAFDDENMEENTNKKSKGSSKKSSFVHRFEESHQKAETDKPLSLELRNPVLMLDLPENNPKVIKAAIQLRKARNSVSLDKNLLRKQLQTRGIEALQEIQTPQEQKYQSMRESSSQSNQPVKRIAMKFNGRRPSIMAKDSDAPRRSIRGDLSMSMSKRESVDDLPSVTLSQNSSQDSEQDDLKDIVDNEKAAEEARIILKSAKFTENFKNKLITRYPYISNICLAVVVLDMLISEVCYFIDPLNVHASTGYHIVFLGIIFLLTLMIIAQVNKQNLSVFKFIVYTLFFGRLISDFIEIYAFIQDSRQK